MRCFLTGERRIAGRSTGIVEITLRLQYGKSPEEVLRELTRAAAKIFRIYPEGKFEVTLTANSILRGPPPEETYR